MNDADLSVERVLDVSPEHLWAAWTTPELVERWFVPPGWTMADCRIELRPGGAFAGTMGLPDGTPHAFRACYLEVVPLRRLVWTDALVEGWRPSASPFITTALTFEPQGAGTRYRTVVLHKDEATRKAHEAKGFHENWKTVTDQLTAVARGLNQEKRK